MAVETDMNASRETRMVAEAIGNCLFVKPANMLAQTARDDAR
jgi:hypothetical protein